MPGIICLTRGRPSSYSTIATTIELAWETGETTHYPYVISLDFLTDSSSCKTNQISQEIK